LNRFPIGQTGERITPDKWQPQTMNPSVRENIRYITIGDLELTALQRPELVSLDRWPTTAERSTVGREASAMDISVPRDRSIPAHASERITPTNGNPRRTAHGGCQTLAASLPPEAHDARAFTQPENEHGPTSGSGKQSGLGGM